jgi:DNA-binding transcriptional regulator LsrR (DeoR family)
MDRPQDPSRAADPARNQLLAGIGRAHFLQNRSKVQIAEDYGLSRFQVANLLQEALERGIVRISIHLPDDEADAALAARLGIDQVVTVGAGHGAAVATREDLARTVADVVARIASPGDTIGVAWSRTLQRAVQHLPPMPTCEFVQLAGAIATDEDAQGPRLLAGLESRTAWPLWAPLVVGDAAALRASPEIRGTLERADDLDVAVIAVGRWREGTSTVWDRVPPEIQKAARDAGAVAEISGRLLDAQGSFVPSPVDDMVVSATLEQISRAGHTVAVAQGAERAVAVLAALRGGIVDTLVCDLDLHQALAGLLDHEPAGAAKHPQTGASA